MKALYDVLNSDAEGNVIRGHGKVIDGEKNLIHSKDNFTAILGVSDTVVINTKDVTLVVNRDKVKILKISLSF